MSNDSLIPDTITLVPMPQQEPPLDDYDPLLGDEAKVVKAIDAQLKDLKAGFSTFLAQVESLLKDTRTLAGEFKLDEVEVSAGVTASGQFVLFGIGGSGGLEGGIKFLFKRHIADMKADVEQK